MPQPLVSARNLRVASCNPFGLFGAPLEMFSVIDERPISSPSTLFMLISRFERGWRQT